MSYYINKLNFKLIKNRICLHSNVHFTLFFFTTMSVTFRILKGRPKTSHLHRISYNFYTRIPNDGCNPAATASCSNPVLNKMNALNMLQYLIRQSSLFVNRTCSKFKLAVSRRLGKSQSHSSTCYLRSYFVTRFIYQVTTFYLLC